MGILIIMRMMFLFNTSATIATIGLFIDMIFNSKTPIDFIVKAVILVAFIILDIYLWMQWFWFGNMESENIISESGY